MENTNNFDFLEEYSFKNQLKTQNVKNGKNSEITNMGKDLICNDFFYNQPYSINSILENGKDVNNTITSKKENAIYDSDHESQYSSPKFGKEVLLGKTLKNILNISEVKNGKKNSYISNNDMIRKKFNSNCEQKKYRKCLDLNIKKSCKDYKLLVAKKEIKNIQVIKLNKKIVKDKTHPNKNIEINKYKDNKVGKLPKIKKLTYLNNNINKLNISNLNDKFMPKLKFQSNTYCNLYDPNYFNNTKNYSNSNLYNKENKDISVIFSNIKSNMLKNKRKSKAAIKISRKFNISKHLTAKSPCLSLQNNSSKLFYNSSKLTSSKANRKQIFNSTNSKNTSRKIMNSSFRINVSCIKRIPNYYFNVSPFGRKNKRSVNNNLSNSASNIIFSFKTKNAETR